MDCLIVGCADLHTRNIVFTIPSVDSLTEQQFLEKFGKPEIAQLIRKDGTALTENTPSYIVKPASLPAGICQSLRTSSSIKIIDFGEAFLKRQAPRSLHTPLAVRAPEALLGDHIDPRVDLWSLGCLVCSFPGPLPEQRKFNTFTALRISSRPAPFRFHNGNTSFCNLPDAGLLFRRDAKAMAKKVAGYGKGFCQ